MILNQFHESIQVCEGGVDSQGVKPSAHTLIAQRLCLRLLPAGMLVLLTGCASVINDSKQAIHVQTLCSGASVQSTCEAENAKGRQTFVTPRVILVERDIQGLRISCKDARFRPHVVWVPAGPDVAMAGNVLLGGLVGASVDVASGRGMAYPSQININTPSCAVATKK